MFSAERCSGSDIITIDYRVRDFTRSLYEAHRHEIVDSELISDDGAVHGGYKHLSEMLHTRCCLSSTLSAYVHTKPVQPLLAALPLRCGKKTGCERNIPAI